MRDGGNRYNVAYALRLLLVLKCDTDHTAGGVERRAAGVTRVDSGVDLYCEERGARVDVPLYLDSRDDARCDRDAFTCARLVAAWKLCLQRVKVDEGVTSGWITPPSGNPTTDTSSCSEGIAPNCIGVTPIQNCERRKAMLAEPTASERRLRTSRACSLQWMVCVDSLGGGG